MTSMDHPEVRTAAASALADTLLAHFAAAGYARCEPPILQPASVFLDLSGEDIRHRLFLSSDASGAEHCLRPEFTIPISRVYLASADAGRPVGYSYCGPIFRYRPNASGEFVQAGLESFGRRDRAAADAEVLTLTLEAAAAAGHGSLAVRIGDAGLFSALLSALDLPPVWSRRIARGHAKGLPLDGDPRGAHKWQRQRSFRRARCACRRRQARRPRARRGCSLDRRHLLGRRPQRRGDRRALSRTGDGEKRWRHSGGGARLARALSEDRGKSR